MRILVVHRYYWPDKAPCGAIISCVAGYLASRGHTVDALSSQPSYRPSSLRERRPYLETVDGVSVRRLPLPHEAGRPWWRVLNALYLGAWVLFKAFLNKYDVLIVATVPPVLGGWFAAVAAKITGARLVYFCMDLHPEVGRVSGDFSHPWLFALLQRLDDWSCRSAGAVLVHSEDMKKALRARRRGGEYKIQIMNNFALPSVMLPDGEVDFGFYRNRLTLIYVGNIGRFQGLEWVIEAMSLIANRKDIQLVIIGDGVSKEKLELFAKETESNVRFINYQPLSDVKVAIRQADIGLVTLIPEMFKYAYPSKTMTYLEQGRPVIAAVEVESELAHDMQTHGYGFSVPIGDANSLATLLLWLADNSSWRTQMSVAALNAFERTFSPDFVLQRWARLVETGSVDFD